MSRKINQFIDHTLLSATASRIQIKQLIQEAVEYEFKAVCVPPVYVGFAADMLSDTKIGICTVVGFPFGYESIHTQNRSIKEAIEDGANEIDIVIPQYLVKNGQWEKVEAQMQALTDVAKREERIVKWIIETANLDTEEIIKISNLCIEVDADFIKTSTGYASKGAQIDDIKLIKQCVGDQIGIKASGGIKSYEQAIQLIEAGATRLGSSSGINIIKGL